MPVTGGGGGIMQYLTAGGTDAATTAWVAQVVTNGGTVSGGRQTTVNTLIAGLKTDGIWTQLDRLWILAAENNIAARTDLVGLELASVVGAPPFTTDRGYTGGDLVNATDYLTTTTNLSAYTKYVQNSAHLSVWSVTNLSSTNGGILAGAYDGTVISSIYDTFTDGGIYLRINDNPASGSQGAPGTRIGHWIANRTGAALSAGFFNGTSTYTINATSGASPGAAPFMLCGDFTGAPTSGSPNQVAMVSFGAGFSGTDAGNFYTRLRTYMTAVGVP